jgi:hypothetical protein
MTDFTNNKAFEQAIADNAPYSPFYKEHEDRLRTFVSYYESCKQQSVESEVENLLMTMRCNVIYSDKATMPIPLYERMKAAIAVIRD